MVVSVLAHLLYAEINRPANASLIVCGDIHGQYVRARHGLLLF